MARDIRERVTRAELAEALAVIREHAYIMNRIVMAALREDYAAVDALGLRLSELDAELAVRWGLAVGSIIALVMDGGEDGRDRLLAIVVLRALAHIRRPSALAFITP